MVRQIVPIMIDGKPIGEGVVLNRWLSNRFNANKNALIAVVGATGGGKTYSALSQLEKWYQFKFGEPFPHENICFSIEEAAKRIRNGNLRRGEILLIEEAGVLMNSLDFQNKISKFFGSVLQSFRSKNIGIIFTLPNISLLNKTARSLLHLTLQTQSINTKTKQVCLKPFYTQTNPLTGKDYRKYLLQKIGRHNAKVERIFLGLPSAEIIKIYEEKKEKFVNKVVDSLIDVSDTDKKEEVEELNPKLVKAIIEAREEGLNSNEIRQKFALDHKLLRKYLNYILIDLKPTIKQADKPLFLVETEKSRLLGISPSLST